MNEKKPTKAVIYCRTASAKLDTLGDSLNLQETRCREFARMRGYEVIAVFDDHISGGVKVRPAMSAMLSYLKSHSDEPHAVLIDDISRLARSVTVHVELRDAISLAGGILESPGIELGVDAGPQLREHIFAAVVEHCTHKNSEKTTNRMHSPS